MEAALEKNTRRKTIKCPICHRGKILTVDKNTQNKKIQFVFPKSRLQPDYSMKCTVCRNQIGIMFADMPQIQ